MQLLDTFQEDEMELEPLKNGEYVDVKPSKPSPVADGATEYRRDTWGNRAQFLFAIIGYTVGIGSVWRFPILCARNGGGAFLIPFFFFMIVCGLPIYYMEVSLGQFCGKNPGLAFDFCPLFKGNTSIQCVAIVFCFRHVSICNVAFRCSGFYKIAHF